MKDYIWLFPIIFIFVLGGVLIIRLARFLSYIFFPHDYYTNKFAEMKPLIKVKNKKISWILSFLVPIPIVLVLYFLRFGNIGGLFRYLSLYTKPKTALYTLGFIYFVESLIFLIIALERSLVGKIYKSKRALILVALFYAIFIIVLFIIVYKYMPQF